MRNKITLDEILRHKRAEVAKSRKARPLSVMRERIGRETPIPRSFRVALSSRRFSIIAEIKRKSPSHGDFDAQLDAVEVARVYDRSEHVSCVSMLTDLKYFGCSLDDLKAVRSAIGKPILQKDFIIDEYQIYEARLCGADAVLLIARILTEEQIANFARVAESLGMDALVECHEAHEFAKLPDDVAVVGINSRNLGAEDLGKTAFPELCRIPELLPLVPKNSIVVAESGVKTAEDMLKLYKLDRISAVLVGAAIMNNADKTRAIENLMSRIPA